MEERLDVPFANSPASRAVDDCWEGRRLLKPNFKVHVEERRGEEGECAG